MTKIISMTKSDKLSLERDWLLLAIAETQERILQHTYQLVGHDNEFSDIRQRLTAAKKNFAKALDSPD